ncbi:MAG: putative glycolipid-binding domain-containing protein [Leptolyngbyaceae cyanobacterium SL_5_9]|nr:putative glycolipid-binding domain-containing protein [Leptolyngbyaceae cyanobacterium SL_5_9]
MSSPNHIILWRRLDLPGHDICRLWKTTAGWQLIGTAVFLCDQMPCLLSYEVSTDVDWRTCDASVSGYVGQSTVALAIAPTQNGHWSINGIEVQEAAGCVDLDLGFTPATNLIAIRRLSLKAGERSPSHAAWLDFPSLRLKQLEQQYHRISDREYEYLAPDVGYAAVLEVDRYGAIIHYPDLWKQELGRD